MSDDTDTMTQVDTLDQNGPDQGGPQIGNTINLRARYYIWTWNNYEEKDVDLMKNWIDKHCSEGHFQREIGEKCGTPHLQGFWCFKNARYFSSLKKDWPKLHIEKANNIKAARDYCKKDETKVGDTIFGGTQHVKDPLEGKKLYDWQIELLKICDETPDERSIYWFFDEDGNCGKTTLAKHLCLKYPEEVLYLSGGPQNCKWGITTFLHNKVKSKLVRNDKNLRIAIFDYTRSQDDKVSYQALEEVKNGIFFNTKYESMQVIFNCPHVVVFSNFLPDMTKLSSDRWKIIDIGAYRLLEEI